MPRPDEISPQRLDALIDGEAPRTGDEEALVGLMTELRSSEGASSDLRARVSGITRSHESVWSRAARRWRGAGWGGRAMAMAPVGVLVLGAVFAVSSINNGGQVVAPSAAGDRIETTSAAEAPPAPQGPLSQAEVTVRLSEVSDLADVGRQARRLAINTGGRTVEETYRATSGAAGGAGLVVVLEVPADRYGEARATLAGLGTISDEETTYGAADSAAAAPPAAAGERLESKPAATARVTVTFVAP